MVRKSKKKKWKWRRGGGWENSLHNSWSKWRHANIYIECCPDTVEYLGSWDCFDAPSGKPKVFVVRADFTHCKACWLYMRYMRVMHSKICKTNAKNVPETAFGLYLHFDTLGKRLKVDVIWWSITGSIFHMVYLHCCW